ncbi:MAG: hypothetical protein K8I30_12935 [Anaerolineae bacterium]|nr:hypothetical protein [Anaerolineae bacterium]
MSIPIILAHGSLGVFDELIFFGVGVIFLAMMGISWLRSRNAPAEPVEEAVEQSPQEETPERFRLD